eukprot:TRINITY_DN13609_c0_g1_i1.p1 TRINITY_DN13609_c0_g1~~TRINITY_DN13609_c0_g1_i1.p1  ORF type:complete len:781 (-),score=125.03 TRINITY_DN13609_c0_g1_i1:147-2489(-)
MGRRRARARAPPQRIPKLPREFDCLFCCGHETVQVKMDRVLGMGFLKCRVCKASFQMRCCYLDEPVDVYGRWVDEATEANYAPYESYESVGDGGMAEQAPARASGQPAGEVDAVLRPEAASSRQPERAVSSQSEHASQSSQSEYPASEADELQEGERLGAAYDMRSPAYDSQSPRCDTQGPGVVPDRVVAPASTCYQPESLHREASEERRRPTVSETEPTLSSRDESDVQADRELRRSARIAKRFVVRVPKMAQQPRKRRASVKTRTPAAAAAAAAAAPVVAQHVSPDLPGPDEVFAVQKLVRPMVFEGETSYVVLWKGYKEPTVEPRCNLLRDIPVVVNAFERAHKVLWRRNKADKIAYTWKRTVSPRSRRMSESVKMTTHELQAFSGDVPHFSEDRESNKRVKQHRRGQLARRPASRLRNKLGAQSSQQAEELSPAERIDDSAALQDLEELEQSGLRVNWPSECRPHNAEAESGPSRLPAKQKPAPEVVVAIREVPVAGGIIATPSSSPGLQQGATPPPATPCTTFGKNTKRCLASEPKEPRRRSPRIASQKMAAQEAGETQQPERSDDKVPEPQRRSPRLASPKMAAPAAGKPQQPDRSDHTSRATPSGKSSVDSQIHVAAAHPGITQKIAAQAAGEPQQPERPKRKGGASLRKSSSVQSRTHAPAATVEVHSTAALQGCSAVPDHSTAPEAGEDSGPEELFAVQRLVRPTVFEGETSYMVLWKGYKEPTVEPRCNLQRDVPQLVENFERAHAVRWRSNPCRFSWRRTIASRSRKAR